MEVSLDPPHLLNSKGSRTPTALIPFCAYNGDMNITGRYIPGLDFPICDQFKPTILDGQLCYALSLKDVLKEKVVTRPGKSSGLTLAIEQKKKTRTAKDEGLVTISLQSGRLYTRTDPQFSTSIHLNNLVKYTDSRPGLYKMSDLKKMTGTAGFLGLADVTKGCQIEAESDCETRKYLEKVQKRCGCLLWSLGPAIASEVICMFLHFLSISGKQLLPSTLDPLLREHGQGGVQLQYILQWAPC